MKYYSYIPAANVMCQPAILIFATSGLVVLKWSLEEGRDAEHLRDGSGSTEQDRQLASFL